MTVKFLWLEPPEKCVCFSGEFGGRQTPLPLLFESLLSRCAVAVQSLQGAISGLCRALFCIVTAVAVCLGLLAGEFGYGVIWFVAQAVMSVMLNLSVMFFVQL